METFDNCGIASILNNINNTQTLVGEQFNIGTTPVTWTATDNSGNTAECSFDVIISEFVGINNLSKNSISVFPNPTTGIITINNSGLSITEINIIDLVGKIIYNSTIFNTNIEINISDKPSGIYFIKIETKNEVFINSIIKK